MIRLCDIYKERAVQEGREPRQGETSLADFRRRNQNSWNDGREKYCAFYKSQEQKRLFGGKKLIGIAKSYREVENGVEVLPMRRAQLSLEGPKQGGGRKIAEC